MIESGFPIPTRLAERGYNDELRPVGLSVAQLDLLATLLAGGGEMRPADLAIELHMNPSTVSRNVARLEANGWVRIGPGRSRREQRIRLTPHGRQVLDAGSAGWARAQRALSLRLGSRGVEAIELLVARLTASG